jgi:LysR family transcriptional regulator, regulator for bpeEF and oprC
MSRDLNDTLMFVKVVERGSFTGAAQALGVPKATLSRKMRELELRLGSPLLRRTTRKLALTDAGQIYYDRCAQISRDLDDAESAVGQLRGTPRGWLRVTAPYLMGSNTLAPMLPEFMARYPELRVEFVLTNDRLDLVASDIDVALRVGGLDDSSLKARRLGTFTSEIYASPEYLDANGEPLSPEDLHHHASIAMPMQRRGNRSVWTLANDRDATALDYPISPVFVVNDPITARSVALGHVGLVMLSGKLAEPFLTDGRLRRVLRGWHSPPFDFNAVFPQERVLAPKVRVFVDFLIERFDLGAVDPTRFALDPADQRGDNVT